MLSAPHSSACDYQYIRILLAIFSQPLISNADAPAALELPPAKRVHIGVSCVLCVRGEPI